MKRFALHALFLLLPVIGYGQSKISLSTKDTLSFLLQLNDIPVNQMHCTQLSVYPVKDGKTKLRLEFLNPSVAPLEQWIDIKAATFHQFEIRKVKTKLQIFQIAESKTADTLASFILLTETPENGPVNISSEPKYTGQKKCDDPISEEEFSALKSQLGEMTSELKKFEILKGIVSLNCLKVEHIRYFISTLELEDYKVRIVEMGKDRIFDFDRAPGIAEDFLLERNKNKVKSMLE